jgi:hypothetical protein
MSLQQSRLIQMPRELRDRIYGEYLSTDGGYVYNFDVGKLRASDPKQRIELNLMYTCRQMANEIRGLPLRLNTITFRTLFSEELRTRAGRWAFFCARARLEHMSLPEIVPRLKADTFEALLRRYGNRPFVARLRSLRIEEPDRPWWWWETPKDPLGEVPSVFRKAEREVLRAVMADPDIQDYLASDEYRVRDTHTPGPTQEPLTNITVGHSLGAGAWRIRHPTSSRLR